MNTQAITDQHTPFHVRPRSCPSLQLPNRGERSKNHQFRSHGDDETFSMLTQLGNKGKPFTRKNANTPFMHLCWEEILHLIHTWPLISKTNGQKVQRLNTTTFLDVLQVLSTLPMIGGYSNDQAIRARKARIVAICVNWWQPSCATRKRCQPSETINK